MQTIQVIKLRQAVISPTRKNLPPSVFLSLLSYDPHPPFPPSPCLFICLHPLVFCLAPCIIYLNLANFYPLSTEIQDLQAVQSSQIFPLSVYRPMRQLGPVSHRSVHHTHTSAPTWSTTYARYIVAPPSP